MFLKNAWYAAGWSDEVPEGTLKQHFLIGEPVLLNRLSGGQLVALEDRCAHRGAPLSMGRMEGDSVRCMYHGVRFDALTGNGLEVPGQPRASAGMKVRTYPVHEREGWVFVWMGDPAKADLTLVPPVAGTAGTTWALSRSHVDYDANYVLINDNLCDFSHLAFVHINSFGGGDESRLHYWAAEKSDISVIERGIHLERWVESGDAPPFVRNAGPSGKIDRYTTYDYLAPGVLVMLHEIYPEGTGLESGYKRPTTTPLYADYTSQTVIPLTEKKTRYYFTWGPRVEDALPGLVDGMAKLAMAAFTEDRLMIEAQQRIHDATPDLAFQPTVHDRGPNQMRLVMDRLMRAEQ